MHNPLKTSTSYSKNFYSLLHEKRTTPSIDLICRELIFKIFSYLNSLDLTLCLQVNKKWQTVAADKNHWKNLPLIIYGKRFYSIHLKNMGPVLPLPKGILKIFNEPCPFWPDKKIIDTHILFWVTDNIEGEPVTLNLLQGLGKNLRKVDFTLYTNESLNEKCNEKSRWILITKKIIPQKISTHLSYDEQKNVSDELNKKSYRFPSLLNLTMSISMTHFLAKNPLFDDWIPVISQEKIKSQSSYISNFPVKRPQKKHQIVSETISYLGVICQLGQGNFMNQLCILPLSTTSTIGIIAERML